MEVLKGYLHNTDYMITKEMITKYLYRYTGFSWIGNHNNRLVNVWILSKEMPNTDLLKEYNPYISDAAIEKVRLNFPYEILDDTLWLNENETICWINDLDIMNNNYEDVREEFFIDKELWREMYDIHNT